MSQANELTTGPTESPAVDSHQNKKDRFVFSFDLVLLSKK